MFRLNLQRWGGRQEDAVNANDIVRSGDKDKDDTETVAGNIPNHHSSEE